MMMSQQRLMHHFLLCLLNSYRRTDTSTIGNVDPFDRLPSSKAYEMVYDLRLTEKQLEENGFPRKGEGKGRAIISNRKSSKPTKETERYCCRCGDLFSLAIYDKDCVDTCNYHPKTACYKRGK